MWITYFANSRLHLLGTFKNDIINNEIRYPFIPWLNLNKNVTGTPFDVIKGGLPNELSSYLQLQESSTEVPLSSAVIFVDYDAFFVEASRQKTNLINDVPIGVAHTSGNKSELASINYAARDAGVKKGMYLQSARHLCPDIHVISYDFDNIKRCAHVLYDVLNKVSPRVLVASIDEGYVQICGDKEIDSAVSVASWIRREIHRLSGGLTVSTGISHSKLFAKLAGDLSKPFKRHEPIRPLNIPNLRWMLHPGEGISVLPPYVIGPNIDNIYPMCLRSALRQLNFPNKSVDWSVSINENEVIYRILPDTIMFHWAMAYILGDFSPGVIHSIGPKMNESLIEIGIEKIEMIYRKGVTPLNITSLFPVNVKLINVLKRYWPYKLNEPDANRTILWTKTYNELESAIGKETAKKLIYAVMGIDSQLLTCNHNISAKDKDLMVNLNYGIRLKTKIQLLGIIDQLYDEVARRIQSRRILNAERFKLSYLIRYPGAPLDPGKFGACGPCYSTQIVTLCEGPWNNCKSKLQETASQLLEYGGISTDAYDKALHTKRPRFWPTKAQMLQEIYGSSYKDSGGFINVIDIRGISIGLLKLKLQNPDESMVSVLNEVVKETKNRKQIEVDDVKNRSNTDVYTGVYSLCNGVEKKPRQHFLKEINLVIMFEQLKPRKDKDEYQNGMMNKNNLESRLRKLSVVNYPVVNYPNIHDIKLGFNHRDAAMLPFWIMFHKLYNNNDRCDRSGDQFTSMRRDEVSLRQMETFCSIHFTTSSPYSEPQFWYPFPSSILVSLKLLVIYLKSSMKERDMSKEDTSHMNVLPYVSKHIIDELQIPTAALSNILFWLISWLYLDNLSSRKSQRALPPYSRATYSLICCIFRLWNCRMSVQSISESRSGLLRSLYLCSLACAHPTG